MPAGLRIGVGLPEGGVELPVHEDGDLSVWAESVARGRLEPSATSAEVAVFATALLDATDDSRLRAPVVAYMFCPDPEIGELARIEVRDLDFDAEIGSLKEVAELFSALTPFSSAEPEVVFGDLPAGPAARIRHQYVLAPDDPQDDSGLGPVVQTLVYAVCPPGLGGAVVLTMTWQALAASDDLFELGDELAATLTVERV